MAKYAVGYVLALLMLAVVGLVLWTGGGPMRLPWQNFGGGGFVDIGRPMPIPFPAEPAPDTESMPEFREPPDLIVTHAEGADRLSPMSFCWNDPQFSVCSESSLLGGQEPVYPATRAVPVTLDFQMFWDVDILARHMVIDCGQGWSLTDTWDVQIDLDVPGEYLVEVTTSNARGQAQWVFRIDNHVEGDAGC